MTTPMFTPTPMPKAHTLCTYTHHTHAHKARTHTHTPTTTLLQVHPQAGTYRQPHPNPSPTAPTYPLKQRQEPHAVYIGRQYTWDSIHGDSIHVTFLFDCSARHAASSSSSLCRPLPLPAAALLATASLITARHRIAHRRIARCRATHRCTARCHCCSPCRRMLCRRPAASPTAAPLLPTALPLLLLAAASLITPLVIVSLTGTSVCRCIT